MDFDKYKNMLPYTTHRRDPAIHKAYMDESARLEALFKTDALRDTGFEGHPMAEKFYQYAYAKGHAYGYSSVYGELLEMAEIFLD